jgi:hypothetical protein
MPGISWLHDGRRLTLPVSVFPSATADNASQYELVTGLLDTGATGTGLRQDVIDRLKLRKKGRRRVSTANGDVIANEHLIRIGFYPGSFESHPFELAGILPFVLERQSLAHSLHPNFSFEIIIGMHVISQADLMVSRDGRCSLEFG